MAEAPVAAPVKGKGKGKGEQDEKLPTTVAKEIIPVEIPGKKKGEVTVFDTDEHIRADTTLEALVEALTGRITGITRKGKFLMITFADGKAVGLVRDQARWRLDAPLVSRTHAARPREAVRMFAEAIRDRDLEAFLRSLTRRRREGLMRQLDGFLAGLERKVEGTIEEIGNDRAELRWDEAGMRYRIVIRKEDDAWLIDDIHIQPAPEDEPAPTATDDQPPPDIF